MALTYSKGKWISAFSLSILCAVGISGCSKKDKEAETTAETDAAVETQTAAVETQIPCDDTATLNSLSRSIKGLVAQQARTQVSKYATQVGTDFDMSAVNNSTKDIIVDFGAPKSIEASNANGMQTCQASLSLTLPSENIYLANEVYNGLDGKSMQQTLAASNVRLNNNMLVDDAFTYVVGMQGGQAVAKVAGQPAIIKAVADIMAKSQLKEMMATNTNNRNNAVHPAAPATPRPPAEPRVQDDTATQSRRSADNAATRTNNRVEELRNAETVRKPAANNAQAESAARAADENRIALPTVPKVDEKLTVPTDDSVEMVIVEENATY